MELEFLAILPWLIAFAAGLAVGVPLGYFIQPRSGRGTRMEGQLRQSQAEMAAYRQAVTEHYARTADLVNELTRSYKAVHDHLSEGASRLCEDLQEEQRLGYSAPRLIDTEEHWVEQERSDRIPSPPAAVRPEPGH